MIRHWCATQFEMGPEFASGLYEYLNVVLHSSVLVEGAEEKEIC